MKVSQIIPNYTKKIINSTYAIKNVYNYIKHLDTSIF